MFQPRLTDDIISQQTQPVDCVVVMIFIFILVDWEGDLHLHAPAEIRPDELSVNKAVSSPGLKLSFEPQIRDVS